MSYFKTVICLAAAVGFSACSASTQDATEAKVAESAEVMVKTKTMTPVATVKPGANVTLNSVLPKAMTSGAYQTVQLRFTEAYNDGQMAVRVEPTAGLKVFGGTASKTFDMTKSGAHVWDLDVKSDVDGVYFLNIFAEAQGEPRTFSVQLKIGQTTQKMFDDAMPADGELTDGGKIRVLEADETIQ